MRTRIPNRPSVAITIASICLSVAHAASLEWTSAWKGKELRIRSATSGKYLTADSPASGATLRIQDSRQDRTQKWTLIPTGGLFYIRSKAGRFLSAPQGNGTLQLVDFTGDIFQKWRIVEGIRGGFYIQAPTGTYLDVQGAGTEPGTPVWTWPFNGSVAQQWTIEPDSVPGASRQPLFMASGTKWTSMPISVCWENASTANAVFRADVRRAIGDSWERHSAVRFMGWAACNDHSGGIRIGIADEGPHTKALGRELDGMRDGMLLNDTFQAWSPACRESEAARINCVRSNAMHEFGHALGFSHEHNRSDCGFRCSDAPQGQNGDYNVTDCDALSILNYCSGSSYRGALSPIDIEGVRGVYGSGRFGATEVFTFRPQSIGVLCPTNLMSGDREFGTGPRISATAEVRISADSRSVVAVVSFFAIEPQGDNPTSVEGFWERVIYTAEPGKRIARILSDTESRVAFTGVQAGGEFMGCNDGTVETPVVDGGRLVRRFLIIGDTGGDDVSNDDNCGCDTQIRGIEFNAIRLQLESM